MAWAQKHGARPPAFAIAAARAAGINLAWLEGPSQLDQKDANCCLAAHSRDTKCCEAKLTTALSTNEKRSCCTTSEDITSDVATTANDSHRLIGLRALTCRGHALHWLAAVPMLIVPPHALPNDLPLVERYAPDVSDVADSRPESPDLPPPKVASLT
jgi:hypothetical protein